MRVLFVDWLLKKMKLDLDIILVTADVGYGLFDRVRELYPDRFINVGAAEQLMLGVGVGLFLEGKKPILYTITPFLLYRGAEWIRNYLVHDRIKCFLVGSGLDEDYSHDGYTHHAREAYSFSRELMLKPNIPTLDRFEANLDYHWYLPESTITFLRR